MQSLQGWWGGGGGGMYCTMFIEWDEDNCSLGHRGPSFNCFKCLASGVEELLGVNELELKAANGTALPYCGWTEIDFSLLGTNSDYGLKIPFLVSKVALDLPIVGYNVIEEITRRSAVKVNQDEQTSFVDVLCCSLMDIERAEVEALVAFLQSERTYDLCNVKTTKRDIVIQPGQSVKVVCHVDVGPLEMRVPVLFEPNPECPWAVGLEVPETLTVVSRGARVSIQVNNPSNRAIVLKRRTVLGTLQMVRSINPMDVIQSKNTNDNTEELQCGGTEVDVSVNSIGSKEKLMGNRNSDGLPEVNLEGLTNKQKWKVQQMLKEEADSFSREGEIAMAMQKVYK